MFLFIALFRFKVLRGVAIRGKFNANGAKHTSLETGCKRFHEETFGPNMKRLVTLPTSRICLCTCKIKSKRMKNTD